MNIKIENTGLIRGEGSQVYGVINIDADLFNQLDIKERFTADKSDFDKAVEPAI